MTNQETTPEEVIEEPTAPKKKKSIRPIITKVLIWTGAAVGITAAAVLIGRTTRGDFEDENVFIIEESEPNRLIIEEVPQADEPTE